MSEMTFMGFFGMLFLADNFVFSWCKHEKNMQFTASTIIFLSSSLKGKKAKKSLASHDPQRCFLFLF